MRTGAAAGHQGYYHEAVCYDSDEYLLAVAVPFLVGGVAAGEPTVVSLGERSSAVVRAALPAGSGVTFMVGDDVYARPAGAIRAYRKLLASYVAGGARQIRIIGEMSPAVLGPTWDWWARYESAINHAYDEFPLWGICAYDTRTTPAAVLADVARTHPRTALPNDRHPPNPTYTDPVTFLSEPCPPVEDPLLRTPPVVDLTDPTPSAARHAAEGIDPGRLSRDRVDGLLLAVGETVSNALRHGRAPVRMRAWAGEDRIVVTVTDRGEGPRDPFAGLLPAGDGSLGGLGLWIIHQTCDHVALYRDEGCFTVRLTAGA